MLYNTISKFDRTLIVIAVMAATLMQVLDITIVNVALPHMQGTLSATTDQITWVLTSYLVSSAIFMPLTGYFTDRLGRKKYLLGSILGFVISSALCGAATSITEMVIFRLLQGIFGAALVPLSQAIMADLYPPEERGKAMTIWGIGVMVGPILGPTLGGYLTEIASWRWNFYINIPVGIVSFLIILETMTESSIKERRMDWLGLLLISTAIGSLQYFLDRGNRADWFSATDIKVSAFLTVFGLLGFITYSHFEKNKSVFDVAIFKDRNFVICSSLLAIFVLGLFGAMVVLPLMLENLFHYPVLTTGLLMAPRGISGMVGMMLAGRLMKTIDSRKLIITGIIVCMFGTYACTRYNLVLNSWWIVWPLLFQGLGLGLVFVPLSATVFTTLPDRLRTEAAGLFSLLRTLGSSIGISIIITIFSRHTQMAWNQLGGFIQPYNPVLPHYLDKLHMQTNTPVAQALLGNVLSKQAQMVAFVDVYAFIAWSFVCMLPLVFLLKKGANKAHNTPVISD
jgi:DHA2 family multidrug resistance protein